jgi:hypothetical protein
MDPFFYTPEEIALAGNSAPTKGEFCPRCKMYIPYAVGMTPEVVDRLRVHLPDGQTRMDLYALREQFGFPPGWVKIWLLHRDEPHPETPCPYCSLPLRTPYAKQCRHCRRDWHDLNNIKFLGE